MRRVVHARIHALPARRREELMQRVAQVAGAREWRGDAPWFADAQSQDLFSMEYFRHATAAAQLENPELGSLSAAGFTRLRGDECDALAILFMVRELSERLACNAVVHDPENPIAKLRHIELRSGRLPDGAQLEAILVARPIFKRLPGTVIEMYPPRALGSAFGRPVPESDERRGWSFLVHGMRGSGEGFLEAEAEAMRIYRGLRRLP